MGQKGETGAVGSKVTGNSHSTSLCHCRISCFPLNILLCVSLQGATGPSGPLGAPGPMVSEVMLTVSVAAAAACSGHTVDYSFKKTWILNLYSLPCN